MAKLNIGVMKTLKQVTLGLKSMISDDIERHLSELDKECPKDYIDHYLVQAEKDTDFSSTFSRVPKLERGNYST